MAAGKYDIETLAERAWWAYVKGQTRFPLMAAMESARRREVHFDELSPAQQRPWILIAQAIIDNLAGQADEDIAAAVEDHRTTCCGLTARAMDMDQDAAAIRRELHDGDRKIICFIQARLIRAKEGK